MMDYMLVLILVFSKGVEPSIITVSPLNKEECEYLGERWLGDMPELTKGAVSNEHICVPIKPSLSM